MPEIRNKGYSRKLIKGVVKFYKRYHKNSILYLAVWADNSHPNYLTNEQLIEFYKSKGFNIIEHDYNDEFEKYTVMAMKL